MLRVLRHTRPDGLADGVLKMKRLDRPEIDRFRMRSQSVIDLYGFVGDETCGVFEMASPEGGRLKIIASSGGGWEHVSISRTDRTPTWKEMEFIKRLFFLDNETAMQLHVKPSEHINRHPNCLHLWRPNDGREIPLPPANMVG